ncbi:MAG: hypothetical protein GX456_15885 [Verrucomicrobia bacterium]|nr:hypothetical protein [Verrucomicrobiota bacterium]
MAPFDLAADPDGFSRAAADAVGVGRREAFGVRQLAAALSLCTNNVSVPISASEGFFRRLQQTWIGTTDNLRTKPESGRKTQIRSLSLYFRTTRQRARHFVRLTPKGHTVSGVVLSFDGHSGIHTT